MSSPRLGGAALGHASALLTVAVWGSTFMASKVLLETVGPMEILIIRFAMGLVVLKIVRPRGIVGATPAQELTLAAAGLCAPCLYYLLEIAALTMTMASNVGTVISTAPFFTALFDRLLCRGPRLGWRALIGSALAICGVALISSNGARMQLSPLGDLLTLGAAVSWALYSLLARKIAAFGYDTIATTRRTFLYGLALMAPVTLWTGFHVDLSALAGPVPVAAMLYLGVGASALGFVTWNVAVRSLGPVRASAYIYLSPVIALTSSALVLGEPLGGAAGLGTALILAGLLTFKWRRGGA